MDHRVRVIVNSSETVCLRWV